MKWKPLKALDYIVVHASATPPSMDIGAEEIRGWHLRKGWLDIGYHKVIRRDGTVEDGRDLSIPGAHVRGYNHFSWGICMVGGVAADKKTPEDNYTPEQYEALELLLRGLESLAIDTYDKRPMVLGHRDFPNVAKACPCFDVDLWWTEARGSNKI